MWALSATCCPRVHDITGDTKSALHGKFLAVPLASLAVWCGLWHHVKAREGSLCRGSLCTRAWCAWRCRNARTLGLDEIVVLGRSLIGKYCEDCESRPPPDSELWEKNVGALAEAFEAVRPLCSPPPVDKRAPRQASVGPVPWSRERHLLLMPATGCPCMTVQSMAGIPCQTWCF